MKTSNIGKLLQGYYDKGRTRYLTMLILEDKGYFQFRCLVVCFEDYHGIHKIGDTRTVYVSPNSIFYEVL